MWIFFNLFVEVRQFNSTALCKIDRLSSGKRSRFDHPRNGKSIRSISYDAEIRKVTITTAVHFDLTIVHSANVSGFSCNEVYENV